MSSEFYSFKFNSIDGSEMSLESYKNKVVLIVNTASMCGFTKQYGGLQDLYESYKDKGLVVLGVPSNSFMQEHSSEEKVKDFCETNFNISFPMTKIVEVTGDSKHPLYSWLKDNYGIKPKWNFHKILVDKKGNVVDSFSSLTKPKSEKLIKIIEEKLKV
jgi:glutathione peroxidase